MPESALIAGVWKIARMVWIGEVFRGLISSHSKQESTSIVFLGVSERRSCKRLFMVSLDQSQQHSLLQEAAGSGSTEGWRLFIHHQAPIMEKVVITATRGFARGRNQAPKRLR